MLLKTDFKTIINLFIFALRHFQIGFKHLIYMNFICSIQIYGISGDKIKQVGKHI